jgi:hypothetical protein
MWIRIEAPNHSGILEPAVSFFLDEKLIQYGTLVREKLSDQESVESDLMVQYRVLRQLQKVASILNRLRVTFKEARYLFDYRPAGWLDLNALPVEENLSNVLFDDWERLVDAFQLRDRLGPVEPDLFDLFDLAAVNEEDPFLTRLAERTGWDHEDLTTLHDHFGFDLSRYQDERTYVRLEECFA